MSQEKTSMSHLNLDGFNKRFENIRSEHLEGLLEAACIFELVYETNGILYSSEMSLEGNDYVIKYQLWELPQAN